MLNLHLWHPIGLCLLYAAMLWDLSASKQQFRVEQLPKTATAARRFRVLHPAYGTIFQSLSVQPSRIVVTRTGSKRTATNQSPVSKPSAAQIIFYAVRVNCYKFRNWSDYCYCGISIDINRLVYIEQTRRQRSRYLSCTRRWRRTNLVSWWVWWSITTTQYHWTDHTARPTSATSSASLRCTTSTTKSTSLHIRCPKVNRF